MKTVLITGANRGIGFEVARQLAIRGFHVVTGVRSEQHGQTAVTELEGLGKASLLLVDVSDSKSIAAAASQFRSIGRLDVLINNAGIYPDEGISVLTISREQMMSTFQTNTFGALEVTQAFLPYLKQSSPARVINVSSGYANWMDCRRRAELLPFEIRPERPHGHAFRSAQGTSHRGEFDVPWLGQDGHGRCSRPSFNRRRRGYSRMACNGS
jgi:NAD(P)-dependent dehydrogenase (short-subunit alcohol dehydrogenase family)